MPTEGGRVVTQECLTGKGSPRRREGLVGQLICMRTAGFRVLRVLGTCLVGLLPGGAASALDGDRTLTELHHTAWLAKDGAPSQVSALAQTADGFLWIGSTRGLFRFDGVQFERYMPPSEVPLPSHNIYALLATPDGGLWGSFRPSGL